MAWNIPGGLPGASAPGMIHSQQINPGLEATRPAPVGAVQSGASKITSDHFSAQRPGHLAAPLGAFGGKRMPAFLRLKLEREMRGGNKGGGGVFGGRSQGPSGGGYGGGAKGI